MNIRSALIITPKKIVCFILFWTIISDALIAELGMSSSIQYINDFAWVILLLYIMKNKFWNRLKYRGFSAVLYAIGAYILICYLSAILNFVDPLLVIWA